MHTIDANSTNDVTFEGNPTSSFNCCEQSECSSGNEDFGQLDPLNPSGDQHVDVIVDHRCRSPSIKREDDPVMIDVEAGQLLLQQTPALPRLQRAATEDQVLLKTVTVNRGTVQPTIANNSWYAEYVGVPLTYLIGVPAGWLLLGAFQYFVCVITLGDTLLDPWYFTCAWLVEIVCTLHVVIIFMIIKCMYVRVDILDYCEKITWIGFTYLLAQGLAIILLLLPASHVFKKTFGDFSEPSNFFIYWTMIAFPHIMSLCFASFGCCSKLFGSFSRCLRYVSHKNKQRAMIPMHFDVAKQQMSSSMDRDGNNIELQELNFHPSFNRREKNLRFTF